MSKSLVHLFKIDDNYILYDEGNFDFYRLNKEIGENLINLSNEELNNIFNKCKCKDYKIIENKEIESVCKRLVIMVTQKCKLNCKYCYASGGNYGEYNSKLMNNETAQKTLQYFLDKFPNGIGSIQFFGFNNSCYCKRHSHSQ